MPDFPRATGTTEEKLARVREIRDAIRTGVENFVRGSLSANRYSLVESASSRSDIA
jgi:hypothetical protein